MKRILFFLMLSSPVLNGFAQNVGIGISTPTENLHVVGNKTLFENNLVSIGAGSQITPFTLFQIRKNVNTFVGMYVDAGVTGQPFYGYSLNGVASAYHQLNGTNGQYEYYHSNASIPDFQIGNTSAAFQNAGFLGIGTATQTTPFTGLTLKKNVNTFYGMYVDAGVTGQPFYGYALNGVASAYHQLNGTNGQYEYYHSNASIPDFQIGNSSAAFRNASFLGVGTATPTTGFTGFALKSSANNFWGAYVDAGPTGEPFYGYALNGIPRCYLSFPAATSSLEYHQTSDLTPDFYINGNTKAVFNTGFVGIGTSTPTTAFTGFAMKSAANTYWGSYVDAGATGIPFYGYALNGIATAYTTYNGTTNQFEYHHTTDATPDFAVSNTAAVFPIQNFLGIGTTSPTTAFTGLALKSSTNNFWGTYVDAGPTGLPFYGYALNGVARSYLSFNGTNSALEYHQTSDATPDFYINGNTKAVFNTGFVGIGTSTPTTGFTALAMKTTANTYWGSYVDAGPTGEPFYGYALNGIATAYTTYNGTTNQFEYHHTTDATPDFAVSNTDVTFPIQSFLGLGTSTPTTGATGLAIKNSTNGFYGMYVDAGASGLPFYGYALNGVAKAWTEFNSASSTWELNYGGARIDVTAAGNVGIGTTAPAQKLDVNGTIHASNLNGGATTLSTDASGNIIRTVSDARLKMNVTDIEEPLAKVLQMHGVMYDFIDKERFGQSRQVGFLAQELENIIPEAVSSGGEYKSVNYQVLTAVLAEAIKEQQKQIQTQQKENESLKDEIRQLSKRLDALEKK